MVGDEWAGLSFLGPKILSTAAQLYKNPSSFANAFDTELEAQEVFNQLAESTGLDAQHLSGEAATRLVEWSVSRQFVFKRQRRAVAVELECSLFAKRVDAPVEASDAYETMVKDDPKHALEVAKRFQTTEDCWHEQGRAGGVIEDQVCAGACNNHQ